MAGGQTLDQVVANGFQTGPQLWIVEAGGHRPSSARMRRCVSIGTSPRKGTFHSAARRRAPPEPKMSCRAWQSGQTK